MSSTSGEGTAEAGGEPTVDRIRDELRGIVDPCTAATGSNLDIVEMGLVDTVTVADGAVRVEMHLTTPACHMVPYFISEIEERVEPLAGVETVAVETDHGMTWTADMMADSAREKRRVVLDAYDAAADRADEAE